MKNLTLFLSLILISINNSFSQSDYQVSFLSPQADEFYKYGNTPVSLFTGQTNISIPIYTYEDNDFKIPIYLGYDSSGFIPNKREGIVGMNWFLQGGGAIVRKINGIPDDKEGHPTSLPIKLHGLYYGIKNNLAVKQKTKDCLFNFYSGCDVTLAYSWLVDGCEVDPDEFSFSMPGFSGKFYFQNNGEVRCSGNKPFKVILNDFSTQPYYGNTVNPSIIKIVTDDGYTYEFGGNIQYLEVSFDMFGPGSNTLDPGHPIINAWHINKIIAPNGREVVYSYKNYETSLLQDYLDDYHYLLNAYDYKYSNFATTCTDFAGGTCSYQPDSDLVTVDDNVTKTVYLEKIEIDSSLINFNYIENEDTFYHSLQSQNILNQKNLRLNGIQVFYKDLISPIKSFNFDYEYKGSTYTHRLFLTSFTESGKQPYNFTYYNTSNIPNPLTHGIDFWGYWNGQLEYTDLFPGVSYSQNGDIFYSGNIRRPGPGYCDVGLLQTITYPTGGYTTFFYEPHDYSLRLERKSASDFKPQLFEVSDIAGGARIQKIVDNDGTGDTNIREYFYTTNYLTSNDNSSGILVNWPRMFAYVEFDDGYLYQSYMNQNSFSYNENVKPGEKHIQYSEVIEKNSSDGSFTINKFTNYYTNPNYDDHDALIINQGDYDYALNLNSYLSFADRGFNDRSFERGFPYLIQKYSISPELKMVYEKSIDYSPFDSNTSDYAVGVYLTGPIAKSYKQYYYPFLPIHETEKVYASDSDNYYVTTTDYTYDSNGYLLEEKLTDNTGKYIKTTYEYPNNSSISGANLLYERNILNKPVRVENYNGADKQSESIVEHFLKNGNAVPSFTKSVKGNITASNPLRSTQIFNDYDSNGNLLEMSIENGMHTVYVWGYNDLYPIVKIENASYATMTSVQQTLISNVQNATDLDIDSDTENTLREKLSLLRAGFPDAMVTTYTYDPLIGVTSITDPKGYTTFYDYDEFNRLELIKDADRKVLNQYIYHYKGEQ